MIWGGWRLTELSRKRRDRTDEETSIVRRSSTDLKLQPGERTAPAVSVSPRTSDDSRGTRDVTIGNPKRLASTTSLPNPGLASQNAQRTMSQASSKRMESVPKTYETPDDKAKSRRPQVRDLTSGVEVLPAVHGSIQTLSLTAPQPSQSAMKPDLGNWNEFLKRHEKLAATRIRYSDARRAFNDSRAAYKQAIAKARKSSINAFAIVEERDSQTSTVFSGDTVVSERLLEEGSRALDIEEDRLDSVEAELIQEEFAVSEFLPRVLDDNAGSTLEVLQAHGLDFRAEPLYELETAATSEPASQSLYEAESEDRLIQIHRDIEEVEDKMLRLRLPQDSESVETSAPTMESPRAEGMTLDERTMAGGERDQLERRLRHLREEFDRAIDSVSSDQASTYLGAVIDSLTPILPLDQEVPTENVVIHPGMRLSRKSLGRIAENDSVEFDHFDRWIHNQYKRWGKGLRRYSAAKIKEIYEVGVNATPLNTSQDGLNKSDQTSLKVQHSDRTHSILSNPERESLSTPSEAFPRSLLSLDTSGQALSNYDADHNATLRVLKSTQGGRR